MSTSPPSIRRSGPANRSKPACNASPPAPDWSAYWTNFADTAVTVVGTELGAQAADLLNKAADSGGGSIFGDVDAKLRYRNRDWQLWPADELEDAVIGNVFPGSLRRGCLDGGSGRVRVCSTTRPAPSSSPKTPPGSGLYEAVTDLDRLEDPPGSGLWVFGTEFIADYCPTNWEMTFARVDVTTRVLIGRPDMDTPIVLDDEEGQEIYGVETVDVTDLETEFDIEMTVIGNRLLATRGYSTAPRIAGVTLERRDRSRPRRPVIHRRPPHPVPVPLPSRLRRPPSVLPIHVLHRRPPHHRPRHVGSPTVPRRRLAVAGRRRRRLLVNHRDGPVRALADSEMGSRHHTMRSN